MPDNPPQSPKLLEQVRIRLRTKHYAYRSDCHQKRHRERTFNDVNVLITSEQKMQKDFKMNFQFGALTSLFN